MLCWQMMANVCYDEGSQSKSKVWGKSVVNQDKSESRQPR